MARGDAVIKRSKTWWLDFRHRSRRHQVRLGKNISREAAAELATVHRADLLRAESSIRTPKDILLDKTAELFVTWGAANKKPRLSQISESAFVVCLSRLPANR